MEKEARGECPACEMPIPFIQTIKGRGKPFDCPACGSRLVLPKPNLWLVMGLVAVALILAKLGGFVVFVVIAVLIALGDWKFARTRLAQADNDA